MKDPRRQAQMVWFAMALAVVLASRYAWQVAPAARPGETALFAAALAVACAFVALSLLLPRFITTGMSGSGPDALALSRHLLACMLCELGGLAGAAGLYLSGQRRFFAAVVVALLGLGVNAPGDARWARLRRAKGEG